MSAGYVVPDKWVEAAAEAMWDAMPHATPYKKLTASAKHLARVMARHALAAVIPAIQNGALERAAVVAETHQAEVQRNIDGYIAEVRDIQITPLDNWPLIKARDWLKHTAAAIRALKETKE
jgi:hypothetical protein